MWKPGKSNIAAMQTRLSISNMIRHNLIQAFPPSINPYNMLLLESISPNQSSDIKRNNLQNLQTLAVHVPH